MADNKAVLATNSAAPGSSLTPPKPDDATKLRKYHFGQNFVIGTSSSAYQIEGAADQYGRGPSIWDTFTQRYPGVVADGSNGVEACDAYHLFKDDIQMMRKMGVDAYRFSISWPRILPGGSLSRGVNKEGVQYYNAVIDECLANGIEPYVTLFHWDLPQALQDEYEGFVSPKVVDDFQNYVELCFFEFGDRVKHWITLNEPWSFINFHYIMAASSGTETRASITAQPKKEHFEHKLKPADGHEMSGGDAAIEPYIIAHNQILAHAKAVEVYRNKFQKAQKGEIGISMNVTWLEPLDPSKATDQEAALRGVDFQLGWFLEPITLGRYPATMRTTLKHRLPTFTADQITMVKGSFDFIGINYYRSQYATPAPPDNGPLSYQTDPQVTKQSEGLNGELIGPMNNSQWINIYPKGLYDLMVYIKKTYNDPYIVITENGLDQNNDPTKTLSEASADDVRADYIRDHLYYLYQSIQDGVKVKGYFVWAFSDNFEWLRGYNDRMGLIHIDYKNRLARYPNASAIWFMGFLKEDNAKFSAKRQHEENEENNNSNKRLRS